MDVGLPRLNREDYQKRFSEEGLRPDGRRQYDRRPAQLRAGAVGSAHGSASISLGCSQAVAGIRAEVAEAVPDMPALGSIVATVELPPLCSAAFRDKHRASGAATFLGNALTDVLNNPHILDASRLHIREGDLYWILNLHVVCLNYDGNAFDMCLLAALAALEDLVLPALMEESSLSTNLMVSPCGSANAVFEEKRLELKSRPLPVTFAQVPSDAWVVDPTCGEEEFGASVSLCLVNGRWLVYHQGGGAGPDVFLNELMPKARESVDVLTGLLDEARGAQDDVIMDLKG
jgi:exosome complex component RRP43